MTIRAYLIGMTLSTLICFAAWSLVLIYIEPNFSGGLGLALFYLTLFLGLTGIFTIIGFAVRSFKNKQDNRLFPLVSRSFRQGFLLALVLICSLFLQSQRLLGAVNIFIVVLAVSFIEVYFLSRYERGF